MKFSLPEATLLLLVFLGSGTFPFSDFHSAANAQDPEPDKRLPCRLTWTGFSNGDVLPSNAVESHVERLNVVRYLFNDQSDFFIGSYDHETQLAFFPPGDTDPDGNSTGLSALEILTNPFGCELEWVSTENGASPGRFSVPVNGGSSRFVGRGIVVEYSQEWMSGTVSLDLGGILIATEEETFLLPTHQALTSFSIGVTIELQDFVFDTDPFGNGVDFLGMDEIHNPSGASITQTIKHTKRIIETYTITTTRSWASTYTETLKIKLWIATITKTTVRKYSHTQTETVSTTDTTEVSVSRSVIVPPYTSVSICSTIAMKEAVEVGYRANAVFTAPGITNAELLAILRADGIDGVKIVGNDVLTEIDGRFTASLALNTEQFVMPYSPDGDGCGVLQRKYAKL